MACGRIPQASLPDIQIAQGLERIAFGSCNRESLSQPLWSSILETRLDLWI
jgi:hypothetical protein